LLYNAQYGYCDWPANVQCTDTVIVTDPLTTTTNEATTTAVTTKTTDGGPVDTTTTPSGVVSTNWLLFDIKCFKIYNLRVSFSGN
jgi:hypothetical protein